MLLDIEFERQSRMRFLSKPDDSVLARFDIELSKIAEKKEILNAWQFAQILDYHHPGQSKDLYLAHPLRVATMFIQLAEPFNPLGVITALIHNIQEVTNISEQEIERAVNKEVASAITLLTVNRELQWDESYKNNYYEKISQSSTFIQQVKVLDKVDNLFLLCLNPDAKIRQLYLAEIEKWVLPIAKGVMPNICKYIESLIENNKYIGYKSLT